MGGKERQGRQVGDRSDRRGDRGTVGGTGGQIVGGGGGELVVETGRETGG